jgi:hypothetical protein
MKKNPQNLATLAPFFQKSLCMSDTGFLFIFGCQVAKIGPQKNAGTQPSRQLEGGAVRVSRIYYPLGHSTTSLLFSGLCKMERINFLVHIIWIMFQLDLGLHAPFRV